MLHQVGDLFELNVKLRCQKVKIHFNIVILSTAKSSSGVLFPSGFPIKILYAFLFFSILATCPAHSILHDLIMRPLIVLVSPVCRLFPPSQTCMFLSTVVSLKCIFVAVRKFYSFKIHAWIVALQSTLTSELVVLCPCSPFPMSLQGMCSQGGSVCMPADLWLSVSAGGIVVSFCASL